MDYLSYFDLTAEPFAHAPAANLFYASQQHSDALERLNHAAYGMKGLAVVCGDAGLGKSTLARRLLGALPEDEFDAHLLVIVHAGVSQTWLLARLATLLGVADPAGEVIALVSQIYHRLLAIHASGKRAVVLVDEAQMLSSQALMEEFRGLLNLEVPGRKLITFILFGLPELQEMLRLDPPLAQRVALRCRLTGLSAVDTAAYVQHRLQQAGWQGEPPLDAGALVAVHARSGGVPRLINSLCDNLLLELFLKRLRQADAARVDAVADGLGLSVAAAPSVVAADWRQTVDVLAARIAHEGDDDLFGSSLPNQAERSVDQLGDHWAGVAAVAPLQATVVPPVPPVVAPATGAGLTPAAVASPPPRVAQALDLSDVDALLAELEADSRGP